MATPLARAPLPRALLRPAPAVRLASHGRPRAMVASGEGAAGPVPRTCKNCKQQYDPSANHPSACRYHTAHFGGETRRKFESVYAGGTMDTPDSGKVFQYWHCCGSEDPFDVVCLLNEMQLQVESHSLKGEPRISVSVPPTRSDILHARNLSEDVGIAYGFNNVPKSKPKCMTIGGRQPLNRFSDKIRAEVARAGYMEVLKFILSSHEENFDLLNRTDDKSKAVIIANPRTSEFEVVRTSLMSCLLKTLKHNIDHPRPIKIFEVGDVVMLDSSRDVGASNNRRLAALYCNRVSGFEEIMGLVDSIVKVVRGPRDRDLFS